MRWVCLTMVICMMGASPLSADTLNFYDGRSMKGLIVEEHHDRIVVSTADGEKIIEREIIEDVQYDDLAYRYLNTGRMLERDGNLEKARVFYEKAAKLRPRLKVAKDALLGIRSQVWASKTEALHNEVSQKQNFEDAYRANVNVDGVIQIPKTLVELLWARSGLALKTVNDWVRVYRVRVGSEAHRHGIKRNDVLVSISGKSLAYRKRDDVILSLIEPRYSSAPVQYQRNIMLKKKNRVMDLKEFGFVVEYRYEGLVIKKVKASSIAFETGLRGEDHLIAIDEKATRYMSMREAVEAIERSEDKHIKLTIRRTVTLSRN